MAYGLVCRRLSQLLIENSTEGGYLSKAGVPGYIIVKKAIQKTEGWKQHEPFMSLSSWLQSQVNNCLSSYLDFSMMNYNKESQVQARLFLLCFFWGEGEYFIITADWKLE